MRGGSRVHPITESDDEIRTFVAEAEVPPLLPALAYVTGDLSLLRDELRPDPTLMALPQGGLNEEQSPAPASSLSGPSSASATTGRAGGAAAADAELAADHGVRRRRRPTWTEYVPLLEEELALLGRRSRGPGWRKADIAPDTDFRVVIIGAGMSGLLAAHRLAQAGVDFVVLEKNDDVGGTWYENTLSGLPVDNPNHNYSYSFAQRHDWPSPLLVAGRAARLLPALRATTSALREQHPVRHRGAVGDVVRRGRAAGRSGPRTADGCRGRRSRRTR